MPTPKSGEPSSIVREKAEWGVRLILRPFTDPQHANMEISAEISLPKPGRSPEIRTWFSGVPINAPLRATEWVVWSAQMIAIQDEAKKVAAEMKEGPKRKKKT